MNLSPEDVLERVSELLPDADESTLFDAAAWLAARLNVDAYPPQVAVLPDPRAFAGRKGGGVPDMSDAPEAWRGEHAVKRGRSKRGATAKVVGRGMAPVIGATDRDCDGRPLRAEIDTHVLHPASAAARGLQSVRYMRHGASSLDVQQATDSAFHLFGLEPLLGTDAVAYAEVIPGDRSSRCSTAVQSAAITGEASRTGLDHFVAHVGANGSQTSSLPWVTRRRLPAVRVRKSERPLVDARTTDQHYFAGRANVDLESGYIDDRGHETTAARGTLVVKLPATVQHMVTQMLPAPSADPNVLFIGHRAIVRQQAVNVARKARTAKRTIGKVNTAPETVDAWAELLALLNRGERITVGPHVTITRDSKRGQYAARDKRSGELVTWRTRTIDALALRLA